MTRLRPNLSPITLEDTAVAITLRDADVDGNALTHAIVAPLAHGTLSWTVPRSRVSPEPNFFGPDRFTYPANDGALNSATAIVTLEVTSVNDLTVALSRNLSVEEGATLAITLTGSDVTLACPPADGSEADLANCLATIRPTSFNSLVVAASAQRVVVRRIGSGSVLARDSERSAFQAVTTKHQPNIRARRRAGWKSLISSEISKGNPRRNLRLISKISPVSLTEDRSLSRSARYKVDPFSTSADRQNFWSFSADAF